MKDDLHQSPEGLNVRAITLVVIGAAIVGGTALLVNWWMTPDIRLVRTPAQLEPHGAVAGIQQTQLDTVAVGQLQQARARARIHQYAWTDRERDLVSIPIVRAIDMVAAGCRPPAAGESAFAVAPNPSCPPIVPVEPDPLPFAPHGPAGAEEPPTGEQPQDALPTDRALDDEAPSTGEPR